MRRLLGAFVFILTCGIVFSSHSRAAIESRSLPIVNLKKIVTIENNAKDAYLWGYPLVRFERTRRLMTTTPGFGHAPLNTFFHANRLQGPRDRDMSNPLPDTLYSSAFLDLREQPLVLEIPKIRDRYFSLHVMDAFTRNIGIISSRTRGEAAGKFFITGPRYIGAVPAGFEHIRSSTNFAWIVGQTAAESLAVMKSSSNLIRKFELKPYSVYLGKERMPQPPKLAGKFDPLYEPRQIQTAGIRFYDELGVALRENGPTNLDPALMSRFLSADIGPGIRTSRNSNTRQLREAYERAIAAAELDLDRVIRRSLIQYRNGWNFVIPTSDLENDYTLRAAISRVYFAESNPLEALHPVTYTDGANKRLNGNNTYVIRFPKDKYPPVGAFWSLVPYRHRNKGLVENTLRRYSLGSYSKGLIRNPDGSLDIYISANEPRGKTQNWLPVPRENFYVMMNLYNPTNDVIKGGYTLPRIQKVTVTPLLSLNK